MSTEVAVGKLHVVFVARMPGMDANAHYEIPAEDVYEIACDQTMLLVKLWDGKVFNAKDSIKLLFV